MGKLRRYIQSCSFFSMLALLACMSAVQTGQAQKQDSIRVYVFLSETCPICQSSTIELRSLYTDYHDKGIAFSGLFPSQAMSTEQTRQKFEKKYHIPFALTADKDQKMATHLAATITPEVFVIRERDNTILYRGKVDNSYESMGKRRQVVTDHYLKNALENILRGKPADPVRTAPVGCFISKT